ncbi:MAG TPA: NAD(P)H-binding protein [Solirubrobacterales bacterium]|nr:NAD(P)H-binding protein [Solirubrobacterales bacterium]
MLLLTGATGSVGSRLLPLLLERGEDVRCLVRDPRRLGARRVDVQIALGDLGELADPHTVRQSLRGVDTVVHLAATIRDQPPRRIEELNGLATVRLLQAAERAGVRRFVFFSALDAGAAQRTRFFRAKWVAERAVEAAPLETAVFATWEEAELMEVAMVSARGTADAQALGVEPRRMGDVLASA